MDTKSKFAALRAEMYREFGTSITTKKKNRRFWLLLDGILRVFTLGQSKDFMKRTTTIGRWIAFGEDVNLHNATLQDLLTLVHERRHVFQCDCWSTPIMIFLYLLMPLPIGLAYFRYKFEREAVLDEVAYGKRLGLIIYSSDIIDSLTGAAYVWMWPKAWVVKDLKERGVI